MKRDPQLVWSRLRIAVPVVVGLAVMAAAKAAGSAEPCCFTNDRYEGICKVIPPNQKTGYKQVVLWIKQNYGTEDFCLK
jgi:hypothetical protein